MKKILYAVLVMAVSMGILNADGTVLDASKFPDLKKMNVVLQDPVLTIKGAIEKPDSYVLKLEAKSPQGAQLITAFLDKKSSELYIGSAYDKEGKQIIFPKDINVVKEGVAFSYGTGKKEIYLVTDPECPYCIKFEKSAQGKLNDYTVHVILFPLSFHKKSPAMVEWIMQGKDDSERYTRFKEVMLKGSKKYTSLIKDTKKPFKYSEAVSERMKKFNAATIELGVRGTPSLFNEALDPVSQDELLKSSKK